MMVLLIIANDSDAKNRKDDIIRPENSVTYDEDEPQLRKNRPAHDKEAYVHDVEAVQLRNYEPANDEDEPQLRKNRPAPDKEAYAHDEEAVQLRNYRPTYDEDKPQLRINRPE